MLKNIIIYITTRFLTAILLICGVFCVINNIRNNTDNEYAGIANITFNVNEDFYGTNLKYNVLDNTVVGKENSQNSSMFTDSYFALLIDETNNQVYASYNAHRRMYPASMTKLMTAIIVCEKLEAGEISEDDIVTVTNSYDLTYDGVAACELGIGSQITVKDLMHGLLIESNNYYALILADYVAGSTDAFCELMNQKAYELGATNTHFVNPHGLDNPNHYSTAYDMYLILKEADSHEYIRQIDTFGTYSYTYINSSGYTISADISATNLFCNGYVDLPANFSMRTWKTGTTSGAGNCLAIALTKGDNTYYLVASDGDSRSELYDLVVELLCLIE